MVLTYKRAVAHTLVDFSCPGILEWEDVPVVAPKRDEVLIRVKAVALNPIDHKKSLGADFAKVPVNPCSDVSGTVVALGPNTKGTFSIGDEVCCNVGTEDRGLAQYVTVREGAVGPIPEGWSHAEAATLPMLVMTANEVVKGAGVKEGDSVVVLGASGGVGTMVLQLLRQKGAKVLAVASKAKFEHVQRVGGESVSCLDYKIEDWASRFSKANPPDAVIDVSAASPAESYRKAAAMGMGGLTHSGHFSTSNALDPSFIFTPGNFVREVSFQLQAFVAYMLGLAPKYTLAVYFWDHAKSGELLAKCADLAARGQLEKPQLGGTFSPNNLHEAFAMVKTNSGKAVVDMSEGF